MTQIGWNLWQKVIIHDRPQHEYVGNTKALHENFC